MNHFERLFGSFVAEAFRFEGLPAYRVTGGEWEDYQRYLDGEPIPPTRIERPWTKDVAEWVGSGRDVTRVRALPSLLNQYLMFELDWCYPFNIRAGEKIMFVSDETARTLFRDIACEDFWLFDRESVLRLKYDEEGKYLDAELVEDPALVSRYVTIAEQLSATSIQSRSLFKIIRLQPPRTSGLP